MNQFQYLISCSYGIHTQFISKEGVQNKQKHNFLDNPLRNCDNKSDCIAKPDTKLEVEHKNNHNV